MCVVGESGSGKTALILRMLLDNTLDYNKLIICSPNLYQDEYQVIIKAFKSGLDRHHILKYFEHQKQLQDTAPEIIIKQVANQLSEKQKTKIKLETYALPELLPEPSNPDKLKVLVLIDDCMILQQKQVLKYFVSGRPVNINCIFLAQKYSKIDLTIRENTNVWILFDQGIKTIKNHMSIEIGNAFGSDKNMVDFYKQNVRNNRDYIIYIKDTNKWYSKNYDQLNTNMINTGASIIPHRNMTQLEYYQGKAEADRAEKINRDKIRAIEINKSNLFQNTSELFKPIVTKQQESITDQQAASKKSLEMFNYVPGVKRPLKLNIPRPNIPAPARCRDSSYI